MFLHLLLLLRGLLHLKYTMTRLVVNPSDADMLEWLCSKGYLAAGINYTLFGNEHPDANVYSQSI